MGKMMIFLLKMFLFLGMGIHLMNYASSQIVAREEERVKISSLGKIVDSNTLRVERDGDGNTVLHRLCREGKNLQAIRNKIEKNPTNLFCKNLAKQYPLDLMQEGTNLNKIHGFLQMTESGTIALRLRYAQSSNDVVNIYNDCVGTDLDKEKKYQEIFATYLERFAPPENQESIEIPKLWQGSFEDLIEKLSTHLNLGEEKSLRSVLKYFENNNCSLESYRSLFLWRNEQNGTILHEIAPQKDCRFLVDIILLMRRWFKMENKGIMWSEDKVTSVQKVDSQHIIKTSQSRSSIPSLKDYINIQDTSGNTVLDYLIKNNEIIPALIDTLLNHGAERFGINREKEFPLLEQEDDEVEPSTIWESTLEEFLATIGKLKEKKYANFEEFLKDLCPSSDRGGPPFTQLLEMPETIFNEEERQKIICWRNKEDGGTLLHVIIKAETDIDYKFGCIRQLEGFFLTHKLEKGVINWEFQKFCSLKDGKDREAIDLVNEAIKCLDYSGENYKKSDSILEHLKKILDLLKGIFDPYDDDSEEDEDSDNWKRIKLGCLDENQHLENIEELLRRSKNPEKERDHLLKLISNSNDKEVNDIKETQFKLDMCKIAGELENKTFKEEKHGLESIEVGQKNREAKEREVREAKEKEAREREAKEREAEELKKLKKLHEKLERSSWTGDTNINKDPNTVNNLLVEEKNKEHNPELFDNGQKDDSDHKETEIPNVNPIIKDPNTVNNVPIAPEKAPKITPKNVLFGALGLSCIGFLFYCWRSKQTPMQCMSSILSILGTGFARQTAR